MSKKPIKEISDDLMLEGLFSDYIDYDQFKIFLNYSQEELKEIILNLSQSQVEINDYPFTDEELVEFKEDIEETKNVLIKMIRIKDMLNSDGSINDLIDLELDKNDLRIYFEELKIISKKYNSDIFDN